MNLWREMFDRLKYKVDQSIENSPYISLFDAWDSIDSIHEELWTPMYRLAPPVDILEKKELEDLLESLAVEAIKALYFIKKYKVKE